jgi:ABC-type transporter MlaC component
VGGAVNAAQKEPNDANDPNYPADPNELVRLRWDAVISVLQNKELDQNAKDRQIDKIVSPIFDFPLMAKLVQGALAEVCRAAAREIHAAFYQTA